MMGITILLFIISMDFVFYSNGIIDLIIVIVYLILVARTTLKLETEVSEVNKKYILNEKKTALFTPLIFLFFLSTTIGFGTIAVIINILIIVLLYGYVYVSITRNKIIVTSNTIKAEYLNGKSITMNWSDIVKVDFDWIYNMLIFSDSSGVQIKLDISLKDFLLIITMLKERLLKTDYEIAFQKLHNYYLWFLMKSNNIHL
ncbi:MAG: hypothetical protein KAH16_02840 [Candidatus Izimaplasma sp.]|nr:hypothetical protein [Candidatus Izimaplasma bacterium]